MNQAHLEMLASDDWRELLEELAFPFAFGDLTPAALGEEVLEIGPGPGLTTDLLHPQVPHLTAVELETHLADALRERLAGTNVTVVQDDATATRFDDASFSGAVSFTMLHHVPTADLQDRLFGEVRRVLRPGGLFVANDSVASDDLLALHEGDVYNPIDPSSLTGRLERAGFVDVEVRANPFAWAAHAYVPAGGRIAGPAGEAH